LLFAQADQAILRAVWIHGSRAIQGLAVIQTNSAGSRITSND